MGLQVKRVQIATLPNQKPWQSLFYFEKGGDRQSTSLYERISMQVRRSKTNGFPYFEESIE